MRLNDVASSSLFLCIGLCFYNIGSCQDLWTTARETSPIGSFYSSLKTPSSTTTMSWPTKVDGEGGGDSMGCKGTVCPPDRYCVDQGRGVSCVCWEICAKRMEPVCGSNFVTYDNVCELFKESCSSSVNITIIFRGKCADAKPDSLKGEEEGDSNHSNRLMASTMLLGIASLLVFMRR